MIDYFLTYIIKRVWCLKNEPICNKKLISSLKCIIFILNKINSV